MLITELLGSCSCHFVENELEIILVLVELLVSNHRSMRYTHMMNIR